MLFGKFIPSSRAPLDVFRQKIAQRFATQGSRFRFAISSGFMIAAAGALIIGADPQSGVAQSIFGMMNWGGDVAPQPPQAPSAQYYTPRQHHARHRSHDLAHYARLHGDADRPVSLVRKSMCVRLCDGFAFPVGDYHGEGDRAAHESTCQSECPGAETALFVVPAGADSIGDAIKVGSHKNYSEMPEAFHYTTYVDETCSCHPQGGNRIKSLLHDFTLRRGDAVMTPKGLRVFHGGGSYPYTRKDFVALAKSQDIRQGERANMRAMERASLVMPATSAGDVMPAQLSDARTKSTKYLQHQARN